MVAYTYQMPSGIPGNVSRPEQTTIEQKMIDPAHNFTGFGLPAKSVSGLIRPIESGDLASVIVGVLARPYPTSGNGTDGLGVAVPNTQFPADLLKRGYINVTLNGATNSAAQGKVYVRTANAATGKPIGGFEAVNDASVAGGTINGTGTGTIAATVGDAAQIQTGKYTITLQTTSNTAPVTVIAPNGDRLPDGVVGTAYSQNGLNFTITAAGTMTRGDFFQPVVSSNTVVFPFNSYFTGPADASANAEIAVDI